MTNTKIIVGYDGSPEAVTAAGWALDEAARADAPLEFLYAYEWPTYAPAASLVPATSVRPDGETERRLAEMLDEVTASAARTHPGVRVSRVTVRAPAALTLIDRSADAAAVVLGSRGHSAFAGLLLGSVSVAVTAHAHCPVIVVRGAPPGPEERSRRSIVVGVDDSGAAEPALDYAFGQAARRAADLRVIRAWTPPADAVARLPIPDDEITAAENLALQNLVAGRQDKYPTVRASAQVVVDHPARALENASHTAQLLVVGSRGRGAFHGLTLGSVSQHLLRRADCPVAVVREPATA
jgi:nucleotide-binding universal stress UspA family protein